jgi:YbbR domain-containing protein
VVGGVTVDPATVAVVGPAGALANLSEAITEPVAVSGRTAPVTDSVTIGVADPNVRLQEAQRARVTVMIAAAPEEWVIHGVSVRAAAGAQTLALSPATVSVWLRGPRTQKIDGAAGVSASIDPTGLGAGRHRLPVRVEVPPGLALLRVDPADVTVTIR